MYFLNSFLFAAAYFLTANFSSLFTIPLGFPSSTYFASGIALAGLILGGYRYLPSILIGSLAANLMTLVGKGELIFSMQSVLAASLLALTASLQAALSLFLIQLKAKPSYRLERGKDILKILIIGGPIGCTVNATLGSFVLSSIETLPLRNSYLLNWFTWWVGDFVCVLLIVPLILILMNSKIAINRKVIISLPVLILLIAMITLFLHERKVEQQSTQEAFKKMTLQQVSHIKERTFIYEKVLQSIKHFYAASQFVDRNEFRAFVEGMYSQYKGIQALKWIPRVLHKDKKKYERLAQKDGLPNFHLTQKGGQGRMIPVKKREEHFPIYYIEPSEKNTKILGLDLSSIPEKLEVMQAAKKSGKSMATAPIRLSDLSEENTKTSIGFLVFHPIYELKHDQPNALKGFALGLFKINDLIHQETNPFSERTTNLYIYDEKAKEKGALYGSQIERPVFSTQNTLNIAGRKWILEFTPTHSFFLKQKHGWKSWLIFIIGSFFIIFLQIFLLMMTARTELIKRLVNEKTLEIQKAKDDLEQAVEKLTHSNTELERFAYIASHDLQEPLRMVVNFTSLLKKEYKEKLDQQALKYIRFSTQSANRMQNLINDLLEYSRLGQEAERFVNVDCVKIIQNVIHSLSESIQRHNAKITYDPLPVVHGNPIRITRLFQNLIGNSIKYTHTDVAPRIHIGVQEKTSEWLFSVKDNGIGMKKEYLEKIFIPFKRLHPQSKYTGTGIGLSICKKITESLNGRIWASSKSNVGSTFYFTIPKKQTQEVLKYA